MGDLYHIERKSLRAPERRENTLRFQENLDKIVYKTQLEA